MFAKIWASSLLVSAFCLQVTAHAVFSPVLGVQGVPQITDVQKPSKQQPCGITNIANTFDSSKTVTADADGNFEVTGINFNGTPDGSLQAKTGRVSPDATAAFNDELKIITNGPNNPPGRQQATIKAQLPKGLKCTGPGNKCLAQFITTAGFGNCVVVQQSGQSGNGVPASGTGASASSDAKAGGDTTDGENSPPGGGNSKNGGNSKDGGNDNGGGNDKNGGNDNGGGNPKNGGNPKGGDNSKGGADYASGGNSAGGNSAGGGTTTASGDNPNATDGNLSTAGGDSSATSITASCTTNAASTTASADPANATAGRVSGRHMARLLADLKKRGEGAV